MRAILTVLAATFLFFGCSQGANDKQEKTPWGSTIGDDDDALTVDAGVSFDNIIENGELIVLTLSGPDTYFDYHGRGMGTQYLLCSEFARSTGLQLRVELCSDTADMIERLRRGEGDIALCQLADTCASLLACGYSSGAGRSWMVSERNVVLADTINSWYRPSMLAEVKRQETQRFSAGNVRRETASPMLNAASGVISKYDGLFRRYASTARWDWRLLAAQCFQESAFDERATSWAGACGLMQIMPGTAELMRLATERIYDPEENIRTAARYIAKLETQFSDITNAAERRAFVLAAYNGGAMHIRDAMALTEKYGGNKQRWQDVRKYVLGLSEARYYTDAVVKNGYMRGAETTDYVDCVLSRWNYYCGKARGGAITNGKQDYYVPQKATKDHRFKL